MWTVIAILAVLWLLGLIGDIGGSLIHLLIVGAVLLFLYNLIVGRRTTY
jgi:hypothetical protein